MAYVGGAGEAFIGGEADTRPSLIRMPTNNIPSSMTFGLVAFVLGYTLFYWGYHHFPGLQRYSFWYLLGFGYFAELPALPPGIAVQLLDTSSGGNNIAPSIPGRTSNDDTTDDTTDSGTDDTTGTGADNPTGSKTAESAPKPKPAEEPSSPSIWDRVSGFLDDLRGDL